MTIYIALLRGINVGGHNIIKMQDLKSLLVNMGLEKVQTYIQSGNIVFQSDLSAGQIQSKIEQEIKNTYGFSITCILITATELEEIMKQCPYPTDSLPEGESIYLVLLEKEPLSEKINRLREFKSEIDECTIKGKSIYLYLRQSIRNSKLSNELQKLDVPGTSRNWKTIKKLETMVKKL